MSAEQLNGHAIPADWRNKHNARVQSGERIHVPSAKELGVIDPRDTFGNAPPFALEGTLPQVYERYVQHNIAEYGGDPAAYACAFLAMHCGVLHTTVEMQTRPNMPNNWKGPNDHSLTLGKTGSNKSGMYKDLTKHQVAWQKALIAGTQGVKRRGAPQPPKIIEQQGSAEGLLRVLADNKGERLTIANDEAMTFYQGSGAHHAGAGASTMTDMVCKIYDGDFISKSLVARGGSYTIPKALATLVMATTFDKFAGWVDFKVMISTGAAARHTIGLISNPIARDKRLLLPGAEDAMGVQLLKLRALRDVRFALEPDAHEAWSDFIDAKEADNAELEASRTLPGLAAWARKYDTRIMSMATIFQAYEFTASEATMMQYESFDVPQTEEDKVGGGEPRQGKLVRISYENLERAINFVEGFLRETQEYFYKIAGGTTEFGPELLTWVAHRLATHSPDDPDGNVITKNTLVHKGPAMVRPLAFGGVTDEQKAIARRWVRALLDYGYIEVYEDKPGARNLTRMRAEEEMANFRIRNEFFEKFAEPEAKAFFQAHDMRMKAKTAATIERFALKLGAKKKAPSEDGAEA